MAADEGTTPKRSNQSWSMMVLREGYLIGPVARQRWNRLYYFLQTKTILRIFFIQFFFCVLFLAKWIFGWSWLITYLFIYSKRCMYNASINAAGANSWLYVVLYFIGFYFLYNFVRGSVSSWSNWHIGLNGSILQIYFLWLI